MPPQPPSDILGGHASKIEGVPLRHVYIHAPLPRIQFGNLDTFAKDSKWENDFNPDLQTDEGPSTG
jgi:hypothetical protein